MATDLATCLAEARRTGTLAGLPDRHFIGGRFVGAVSRDRMESFDPGTGRAFAGFTAGDADDVGAAVAAARTALTGVWRDLKPAERGHILMRAAAMIREEAGRLAVAETLDSGKPLREARGDVAGAARAFEYYAGACDKLEGRSIPLGRDHLAWTVMEPAGVAAQIIPWNFPISTAARGIAPALAAGCTVVVKPAEQTPFTALMLADILHRAGLPAGVINVVTGTGEAAGAPLVAHPGVDHVTFTGSVATGARVMAAAAANITRVVLELGGKSPHVVLADCDLDRAVPDVAGAIFEHAGQVCSAGSRLIVERSIHDQFLEQLACHVRTLAPGHGLTDPPLGPVNSRQQLDRIAGFVAAARARGLAVLTGGDTTVDPATGIGWFFEPTIVDWVPAEDPIAQEEIFGPVLAVQVVEDFEEAVTVANATDYALVAGIHTRDFAKAHRFARDVDAGQVYINEYFAGGIEVPFGGNRKSGFGREKGLEGLLSYCRVKSVAARI